jgi:5-methylcytosine-specific restriction endonuclease McrA
MSWDNYGTYWHIDHIIPCSNFDFSDPIQQKECFNYTNLQPLEAKANIKKSNKMI